MAAITPTSFRKNINGSFKEYFYVLPNFSSGDTLATPLKKVRAVSSNNVALTLITPTAGSLAITTTSADVTGVLVHVIGV